MDIRVLRYFLAVAREETVTKAAESLHLAQPSLSRQLMELEEELGKKLFIRGKRRITLTADGILLRKRAEEIVSLLEKTEQEIMQTPESICGEIAIGGGHSEIVAQAAARLAKRYPEVYFRLVSGDAVEVMEQLDHGTLNFCILLEPVELENYGHLPLPETDVWGVLMRKDNPLAEKDAVRPADIQGLPLILPRRTELQRKLAAWAGLEPEELNIAATFNVIYSNPALLVKSGLGCAFALQRQAATEGGELCFRPLSPAKAIRYGIVWKKHQLFSNAARTFMDFLKADIAKREAER